MVFAQHDAKGASGMAWGMAWSLLGWYLKSHARRSMPKQHSLIYSSNWEHFNCQIIPSGGAGEGFGLHLPNSWKKHSDWFLAQTNACQCQKTLMAHSELYRHNHDAQVTWPYTHASSPVPSYNIKVLMFQISSSVLYFFGSFHTKITEFVTVKIYLITLLT